MKPFHQYWTFSAIRGGITLVASAFIVAVPRLEALISNAPLAVGLAITGLATYFIFDGGVMILLANLLPARATNSRALYGQAMLSVTCGVMLYLLINGVVSPKWILTIVASQAALASVTEFLLAHDTHKEYGCRSCYASSMILAAAAIALPFASGLDSTGLSLALATYIGAYGTSEVVLCGRMLFVEYRSEHPATTASTVWMLAMNEPAISLAATHSATAATLTCADCPADELCHDDSPQGQFARIMAERCPAIVRVTRIGALSTAPTVPVAQ